MPLTIAEAIAPRVKALLASHLGREIGKVTDDAMLVDDLGADSLDGIELAAAIEEEFEIEIMDDEIVPRARVRDVTALIEGKLS
jgi:acyl carrier protein